MFPSKIQNSSIITCHSLSKNLLAHERFRIELDTLRELLEAAKAAFSRIAAANDASIVSELVVAGRGGDYEWVDDFLLVIAMWKGLIDRDEHCNWREAGALIEGLEGEVVDG